MAAPYQKIPLPGQGGQPTQQKRVLNVPTPTPTPAPIIPQPTTPTPTSDRRTLQAPEGDRATSPIIPQPTTPTIPATTATPTTPPPPTPQIPEPARGRQLATTEGDRATTAIQTPTFTQPTPTATTTQKRQISMTPKATTAGVGMAGTKAGAGEITAEMLGGATLTPEQQRIEAENIMKRGLGTAGAEGVIEGGMAFIDMISKEYKSNVEQIQANIDLEKQKKQAELQTMSINVNSQIDDVQRKAERDFAISERAGAMTGAAMSSAFSSGLQNIKDDAARTINKLNNLYQIASSLTGAAADKAIKDYERALSDAKRTFEYNYRDILQSSEYDLNEINKSMEAVGVKFDPDKVQNALGALSLKIQEARAKNVGLYLDNVNKITRDINDRIDGANALITIQNLKGSQLTTRLDANDGEAILGLTQGQLDDYVTKGELTPAMAAGYKTAGLQKAFNTLTSYAGIRGFDGKILQPGQVGLDDVKQLQNYINQGMSYAAAANKIIVDNPNRYANKPMLTPMEEAQIAATQQGIIESQAGVAKVYADLAGTVQEQGDIDLINEANQIVSTLGEESTLDDIYTYSKAQRNGDTTLQCGELVNDYIKKLTGTKGTMGNTFDTKLKTINNIGKSEAPQVGGVFIMPFKKDGTDFGHTGIVTGVNQDKNGNIISINVYEANYKPFDLENGAVPQIRTISAKQIRDSKLQFSLPVNVKQSLSTLGPIAIAGSLSLTKDQKKSLEAALNMKSPSAIATTLKNRARDILKTTVGTDVVQTNLAKEAIMEIQASLQKFYQKGGKTGMIKGTLQKITENFTGDTGNTELSQIRREIGLALQKYRNAISGTAYSNQEGKEISAVFPGINKSEGLNMATINAFVKTLQTTEDSAYKYVLGEDLFNQILAAEGRTQATMPTTMEIETLTTQPPTNKPGGLGTRGGRLNR